MVRRLNLLTVTVLALALNGMVAADVQAQTQVRHYRHRVAISHGGDVVVRTGRSYLDPGPSAEVGTEDRYFSDTLHYNFSDVGTPFTRDVAGFELLPTRLNPPGRPEPLFRF